MNNLEKNRENSDHLSFWDKLRNLRDSILWKKETVEDIKWETSEKSEILKSNVIDSALENLSASVDKILESDEIQQETQDALAEIKNMKRDKVHSHPKSSAVEKTYVVEDRDEEVVEWINQSSKHVEDEIKNWDKEPNFIARSLLNVANKIMGTERA